MELNESTIQRKETPWEKTKNIIDYEKQYRM